MREFGTQLEAHPNYENHRDKLGGVTLPVSRFRDTAHPLCDGCDMP